MAQKSLNDAAVCRLVCTRRQDWFHSLAALSSQAEITWQLAGSFQQSRHSTVTEISCFTVKCSSCSELALEIKPSFWSVNNAAPTTTVSPPQHSWLAVWKAQSGEGIFRVILQQKNPTPPCQHVDFDLTSVRLCRRGQSTQPRQNLLQQFTRFRTHRRGRRTLPWSCWASADYTFGSSLSQRLILLSRELRCTFRSPSLRVKTG